jgi:hypothetical protein
MGPAVHSLRVIRSAIGSACFEPWPKLAKPLEGSGLVPLATGGAHHVDRCAAEWRGAAAGP